MLAEILATGDEIRTGALVDTNSAYISEELEEIGLEVTRHHCVGDDLRIMSSGLLEISDRADIAVVTGGLGPTTDDITAEAAAKAAGVKLRLDKSALDDIRALFEKFGRTMSPSNEKQAIMPEGARILKNPIGTAPGFSMEIGSCRFYFVPGVPFEMKKMLSDHVLPDIIRLQGDRQYISIVKTISTFGIGESIVGEKVAPVTEKFNNIKLGLRASFPEVHVKLYMRGDNEKKMRNELDQASQWIADQLGDSVYSMNGNPMEKEIGDLLKERGASIAIAESCTGGLISDLITNVPGSSEYFLFSGITYSNESKISILGVNPATIDQHGAVSEETVREMAEGVKRVSGADYGLATSGIAGPEGGTKEKPVGTVCVGLATPASTSTKKWINRFRRFDTSYGNRIMNKKWFAMMALEMLRKELIRT